MTNTSMLHWSEAYGFPTEYVVLDIETTGLSRWRDKIIEIAAVKYEKTTEKETYSTLINPGRRIPEKVTELTGITDEDVLEAPKIREVLPELKAFLGDLPIVAHNAPFDMGFLSVAFSNAKESFTNTSIDTLYLVKLMPLNAERNSLEILKREILLQDRISHRALADVYTTAELFAYIVEELPKQLTAKAIVESAGAGDAQHHSQRYSAFYDVDPEREPGEILFVGDEISSKFDKFKSVPKPRDIQPTMDNIDPEGPLYGKSIVFTGELTISRAEAMQLAVNAGAVVKTSVSRKTNYLVVGKQDKSLVGEDGMSTKEENAYAINEQGKAHIEIIGEDEFIKLAKGEVVANV